GLEPTGVLPANLNLTGMSTEDQAKAKASLDALRQEIKMSPGFDCNQVLAAASARNSPPSGAAAPPPPFENPIRDGISRFLANSPDFDFRTTHIDTYLATHAGPAFEGVPDAHRPTVTNQLKRMQRVLRVTLKYEATTALMGEGLDSAYKISSVPRKTF